MGCVHLLNGERQWRQEAARRTHALSRAAVRSCQGATLHQPCENCNLAPWQRTHNAVTAYQLVGAHHIGSCGATRAQSLATSRIKHDKIDHIMLQSAPAAGRPSCQIHGATRAQSAAAGPAPRVCPGRRRRGVRARRPGAAETTAAPVGCGSHSHSVGRTSAYSCGVCIVGRQWKVRGAPGRWVSTCVMQECLGVLCACNSTCMTLAELVCTRALCAASARHRSVQAGPVKYQAAAHVLLTEACEPATSESLQR